MLRAGALGRSRGIRWRGRWEGGLGWRIHVNPWLIHVNVWQKPLQYCKVISLQLIKINGKIKKERKNKDYQLKNKKNPPLGLWEGSMSGPGSQGWLGNRADSDACVQAFSQHPLTPTVCGAHPLTPVPTLTMMLLRAEFCLCHHVLFVRLCPPQPSPH